MPGAKQRGVKAVGVDMHFLQGFHAFEKKSAP
jgi:hypothetical protein